MSDRMAWLEILLLFCYRAGMSIKFAILFFLFYYAISTAITRLRAETGFPDHDLHFEGPIQMITSALGTANLSQQTRAALPLFWFISRAYDGHIMPHQLEGVKIAQRSRMYPQRIFVSMLLACGLGLVMTF